MPVDHSRSRILKGHLDLESLVECLRIFSAGLLERRSRERCIEETEQIMVRMIEAED